MSRPPPGQGRSRNGAGSRGPERKTGPRPQPSARTQPPDGLRRSLTNLGGTIRCSGDAALFPLLEEALSIPEGFDERAFTHGFHAWPARLHPHTARTLIARAPAGAIADPFMGGGTTPLEARLAGRLAVGNDLNPIGLEVAWVRTLRLTGPELADLREAARIAVKLAESLADERRPPPTFRDKVSYALDPQAMHEVWALATILDDNVKHQSQRVSWRVLRAALSSILVKVSRLVSDSVAKVDKSRTTWSPRGRVYHWFKGRVTELADQLAAVSRQIPTGTPTPLLTLGDARRPPPLPPLSAIISSPPYPGIYDYVDHHRLRLLALDLPLAPMIDQEIGSRRESERSGLEVGLARYLADLTLVLKGWSAPLLPQGFIAFVIGDGQLGKKVTPVLPLLTQAAKDAGLFVRAHASQARPVFAGPSPVRSGPEGPKRGAPERPHDRSATKNEHLVWLEKTPTGGAS